MDRLRQDLRMATRVLSRNPGVTLAAVITLALGIGVNAAMFTIVNAVLFRPLPYPSADRIVAVWGTDRTGGRSVVGPLDFRDLRERTETLDAVAAHGYEAFVLVEQGEAERVIGNTVTADFFDVFGMPAELGRTFSGADGVVGAPRTVVLSHGLWQRRFGGDRAAVGETLLLSGIPHTVIGVMPPEFAYPSTSTQLWASFPIDYTKELRGSHYLFAVGRIATSTTLDRAREDTDRIAGQLGIEYPETNTDVGFSLTPLLEETVGGARTALLVLLAAVGAVLLIACANVVNLVLAHASGRTTEVAVRRALGAGTGRLAGQFLAEAGLLTLGGGIAGCILALVGVDMFVDANSGLLPRTDEIAPDARVFGVALLLVMVVTLVLALVQTMALGRDTASAIRAGARGLSASRSRRRLRSALAVSQFALVLPLLAGAGLLMQSVRALQTVPTGFEPEHVLTMNTSLPDARYTGADRQRAYVDGVLERVRAISAVQATGVTSDLPFSGSRSSTSFGIEGRPEPTGAESPTADNHQASPDYFDAMGITVVRGRDFTDADRPGSTPVAVVNEALVQRYFAGEDPIGARLIYGVDRVRVEIVGVVRNVVHDDLRAVPVPEIYVPYAQFPLTRIFLATRTSGAPEPLLDAIRAAVREVDPEQPVYSVRTMEDRLAQSIVSERVTSNLVGTFSALALLLAAIGLYGVISYSVASRAQELGVRAALGARPGDLSRLVLRQGARIVLIGLAIGLAAAFAAGRVLSSLLFGVQPSDARTLAAVSVILIFTALAACFVPARRAMRVDPMSFIR